MQFSLKSFAIDRNEVSNLEYKKFVDQFKHNPPPYWINGQIPTGMENKPVIQVSWHDATQYCRLNGKRLPTEAEWEKAFRGPDGRRFPWNGDRFHASYARTLESGIRAPLDVDATNYDVSYYGVMHMAGNVREWVGSSKNAYLMPYKGSNYRSSKFGRERAIRGGSWAHPKAHSVGWYRDSSLENLGWEDVGFRCAK